MQGLYVYKPEKQNVKTPTTEISWLEVNVEPSLSDILNDPIIRQMMERDRVNASDIDGIIKNLRDREGPKLH